MTVQINYKNVNESLYTEYYDCAYPSMLEFDQYASGNNPIYDWSNCAVSPPLTHDHPERGVAGFVSKLYQCLENNEQSYARWCKHNGVDMFVIDCIPEFTETVLPKLFKHCKFASFVRQLNIYGFQRDTDARKSKDSKGRDACRWYHKYFRPGHHDLFHLIRRKPPRYSRTRKQQLDKNTEIALIAESEDEVSESNKDKRRESISSTSSTSSSTSSANLHPMALQHSSSDGLQSLASVHDQLSMTPSAMNLTIEHLPIAAYCTSNLKCCETILTNQPPTEEEELRYQMLCLQEKYIQMCNSLTDEVHRAFDFIQTQKSKIHFLENLLQQKLSLDAGQILSTTDQFSSNSSQEPCCSSMLSLMGQQDYASPSCSSSTTHGTFNSHTCTLSNFECQPYSLSLHSSNDSALRL
ncbi:HSF-type DNA-binding-domain-containing protein [Sporodiniella umbellata]|nr:HSF-type DNA-binding-domain-containing protein [Sporodiniella umbellata]